MPVTLQLIPIFRQPRTFSAHSNHPETQQGYQAEAIQCTYSELECGVTWITLNNTKTTLVDCKTLTAHVDTSGLHK